MQVISEVGTCWLPRKFFLEEAIKAALDCGSDMVKLQYWTDGKMLAMRRGGAKGLEQWEISPKRVIELAEQLFEKHKRPVLGISVFHPEDVGRLERAAFNSKKIPLAFIKTATQEYQYAALAEAVSSFSALQVVPLYVSVPRDGCLTVGNYHSPQPITWLYAEPFYPASLFDYDGGRIPKMRTRLPGRVGLSDHTQHEVLLRNLTRSPSFDLKQPDVVEKHLCYHEELRGLVPDGGPWSLSPADFKKYVEVAHGSH